MSVVNPEHLFDQARRLASAKSGGSPRQADLRRAISSAYYGLFHAVLTEVADPFIGRTFRHTPQYALVYRSIDHRSLRRVCEEASKPNPPAKYLRYWPAGGFGAEIGAFSTAVIELQEMRHNADYDPSFHATASDAILAIATARSALTRFKSVAPTWRRAFLSLIAFPPK